MKYTARYSGGDTNYSTECERFKVFSEQKCVYLYVDDKVVAVVPTKRLTVILLLKEREE